MTKVQPQPGMELTAMKQVATVEAEWLRKNIRYSQCAVFKPEQTSQIKPALSKKFSSSRAERGDEGNKRCQCGYLKEEHDPGSISKAQRTGAGFTPWSPYEDTEKRETDAYGSIIFPTIAAGQRPPRAKFVRIGPDTPYRDLVGLFKDCWSLRAPRMLVSLIGNDRDIPLAEKSILTVRRAIIRIAAKTGSWIITQGLDKGVGRLVGQGYMEYYHDRPGVQRVPLIGVPTWGMLANTGALVQATEQSSDVLFASMVEASGGSGESSGVGEGTDVNLKQLDAAHTHFLLADNGTFMKPDQDFELRLKVVDAISKYSPSRETQGQRKRQDFKSRKAPVVNILVGGNLKALHGTIATLEYNMPCLVLRGSGGAADFIDAILKKLPGRKVDTEDEVARQTLIERLFTQASSNSFLRQIKATLRANNWVEFKETVLDLIQFRNQIHIIEIGTSGSSKELEMEILEKVMRSRMSPAHRVELALSMNTELSSETLKQSLLQLDEVEVIQLMKAAMLKDRPKFVVNFMQIGVSLKQFLDQDRLLALYRESSPIGIFAQLFHYEMGFGVDVMLLSDVSIFLKRLLGDAYKQDYWKLQGSSRDDSHMQNPERHLFLHSLLCVRERSMEHWWEEAVGGTGSALLACRYLRVIADHPELEDEPDEIRRINALADKYEQKAVDVVNLCAADNEIRKLKLLSYKQTLWADCDLLEMADQSDSATFIAADEVQEVLQWKWLGRMSQDNSKILIYLAMWLPFLIALLKYEADPEASESSEQQAKGETATDVVDMGALKPRRRRVPWYKRPLEFYTTPLVKMYSYYTSYFIFLFGFCYVMLYEYRTEPGYGFKPFETDDDHGSNLIEFLVMIYVITLVIEEIRQMINSSSDPMFMNLATYFSSFWNWLDVFAILCYLPALVMRWMFYDGSNPDDFDDIMIACRSLFIISLTLFIVRMIHCLSLSETVGPKILMLGKMVGDLSFFVVSVMVFMASFGVAINAFLYPNMARRDEWKDTFRSIVDHTFWPIFGEVYPVASEMGVPSKCDPSTSPYGACQEHGTYEFLAACVYAIYIFLTNIILVNLLIAMMVYSFNRVQKDAEEDFRLERFRFQKEFYNKPAIPNPFSFLVIVYRLVMHYLEKTRGPSRIVTPTLYLWERQNKKDRLHQLRRGAQGSLSDRMSTLETRVEYLLTRVEGTGGMQQLSVLETLSGLQKSVNELGLILAAIAPPSLFQKNKRCNKALSNIQLRGGDSSSEEDQDAISTVDLDRESDRAPTSRPSRRSGYAQTSDRAQSSGSNGKQPRRRSKSGSQVSTEESVVEDDLDDDQPTGSPEDDFNAHSTLLTPKFDKNGKPILVPVSYEYLRKQHESDAEPEPEEPAEPDPDDQLDKAGETSEAESEVSTRQEALLEQLLDTQEKTAVLMAEKLHEAESQLQQFKDQFTESSQGKQELDERLDTLENKLDTTLSKLEQTIPEHQPNTRAPLAAVAPVNYGPPADTLIIAQDPQEPDRQRQDMLATNDRLGEPSGRQRAPLEGGYVPTYERPPSAPKRDQYTPLSQADSQRQRTPASQAEPQRQPTPASQAEPQRQRTPASQAEPQRQPTPASLAEPQRQPTPQTPRSERDPRYSDREATPVVRQPEDREQSVGMGDNASVKSKASNKSFQGWESQQPQEQVEIEMPREPAPEKPPAYEPSRVDVTGDTEDQFYE